MKRVDSKRATIFIVVFVTLAFIINSLHTSMWQQQPARFEPHFRSELRVKTELPTKPESVRKVEPAPKTPEQIAAEEQAKFIARYLNSTSVGKPAGKALALLAVREDGTFSLPLNTAIASRFDAASIKILPPLFKKDFITDGLFANTFNDSTEIFSKLKLADLADLVLFARQQVQYSENVALENVLTASMQLELMISPVVAPEQARTWTLKAAGAGFNKKDARLLAEERLLKQIRNDPKISLDQ